MNGQQLVILAAGAGDVSAEGPEATTTNYGHSEKPSVVVPACYSRTREPGIGGLLIPLLGWGEPGLPSGRS